MQTEAVSSDTLVRDALLIALTVSTGAVDAISWLGLGKVFSAFMTGNLVFLGFLVGGVAGPPIGRVVAGLAAFAVGAVLAGRFVRATQGDGEIWPRRVTFALAVCMLAQGAFLGVWASVGGHPSNGVSVLLIATMAFAMGVQTAAVFSLGVRGVFTTAATATLAVLMGDLSGWSQSRGESFRLLAVIAGLVTGAAIGAAIFVRAPSWAPLFPFDVTALVVLLSQQFFGRAAPAVRLAAHDSRVAPLGMP